MTGLVLDDRFQQHETASGHPERPERTAHLARTLRERGFTDRCATLEATPSEWKLLQRVHTEEYLHRLSQACESGRPYIDVSDSSIGPKSFEIARLASGAVVQAVEQVMAGRITNAFCAIRPPGHHAERHLSMGFCLLNNIAIAATHLIENHGLTRVAIVDWDVHHGNGTQHIFEEDPRVLFISVHGHPGILYPGTGYAHERGRGAGEGFTLNIPLLPPGREEDYRKAFVEAVHPALEGFEPEFILISAGFDAHRLDPLASFQLETESFGWMTDFVVNAARKHCHNRLVSILEGGYHLEALGDSVAVHLTHLLET